MSTAALSKQQALERSKQTRWRRTLLYVVGRVLVYGIVITGSFVFMLPLFWMLSTSLKTLPQTLVWPPVWIPDPVAWSNYPEAWAAAPFVRWYWNTIVITFLSVLGTTISCSLVAFSFARLRFRGREFLFAVVLSTMMLPEQVLIIPLYLMFSKLSWVNTFLPMIVPAWFGEAFSIFLLRQFFMTIPRDLDEAAKIDGCGFFSIYWRMILPLSIPALAVVAMFSFNWNWTEFFRPLIYLSKLDNYTVQMGLRIFQGRSYTHVGHLMAMTTVSTIPLILVFFFGQKRFVQGVVMSGLTGR